MSVTVDSSVRVLVVDDSSLMGRVIADGLRRRGHEVVGIAENGIEAVSHARRLRPEVITLDLAMPDMDGVEVLQQLASRGIRTPVIVVSAHTGADRAVEALAAGAMELVSKPQAGDSIDGFLDALARRVAEIAPAAASTPVARTSTNLPRRRSGAHENASTAVASSARRLVVVATSTGGPQALTRLLAVQPRRLGLGMVIVQHMPAGFTSSLADRLDRGSALDVREALDGDDIDPGVALIAPGGSHLHLDRGRVRHGSEPAIGGLRPRADLTIADAARHYGRGLLLVVLTGMGNDGLAGARLVKAAGGMVLVEDSTTAMIYGMPRVVAEAGLADLSLPIDELARELPGIAG